MVMDYFAGIETVVTNPALHAFANQIQGELVVAQVLIRRQKEGWELRHVDDRSMPAAALKPITTSGLREVAQSTAEGAFRPLKSAPNLRRGWVTATHSTEELGRALDRLYPGFVPDWFAARNPAPPITNYRDFTSRQTGMYRVTQHLTDTQAAAAIRACCHPRFCLKLRLWSVQGQAADRPDSKSLIPCLEPCAVMLEFARTAARIEQSPEVAGADGGSIAGPGGESAPREADFSSPDNPRRLQLALEKKLARTPVVCD